MRSPAAVRVVEDVVEHESGPAWDLLLWEDLRAQSEDLLRAGQPEVVDQEADVLGVPPSCGCGRPQAASSWPGPRPLDVATAQVLANASGTALTAFVTTTGGCSNGQLRGLL